MRADRPPPSFINSQINVDRPRDDQLEDGVEDTESALGGIGSFQNMKVAKVSPQVERPDVLDGFRRMDYVDLEMMAVKIMVLGIAAFASWLALLKMLDNIRQGKYLYEGFF